MTNKTPKNIATYKLEVEGFNDLSENQKSLIYWLSKAGEAGHVFYQYQRGKSAQLKLLKWMSAILTDIDEQDTVSDDLKARFKDTAKCYLFHNGLYHKNSGLFLPPLFSKDELQTLLPLKSCILKDDLSLFQELETTLFQENNNLLSKEQSHYSENISREEMDDYILANFPDENERPSYGVNSSFYKNDEGVICEKRWGDGNHFNEQVKTIITYLTNALEYTENDKQKTSIEKLIKFYQSGNPKDFDDFSIAWVNDTDSQVFFIHGFIETYLDPLDMCGSFESIVGFKNKEKTAVVQKIIDNIQYFENSTPTNKEFKKEKAVGLSASSIQVVSSAGEAYPSLPLGVCLPNSDWIREKYGSKSVNLENVRPISGEIKMKVLEEFFKPDVFDLMNKYKDHSNSLHTDLHEITGHGSGRTLPNTPNNALRQYTDIIEEARADLAALYHIADDNLVNFGILPKTFNVSEYARCQYIAYLTNGLVNQLNRVELGNDLKQTHMRNRQLISGWLIENLSESVVSFKKHNDKHFVDVFDTDSIRNKIGELLKEVQRIKSEGDFKQAQKLVETYGTKINQELHKEVLNRYKSLNLPTSIGFETPMINGVLNDDGKVENVELSYENDFIIRSLKLLDKNFETKSIQQHYKNTNLRRKG